MTKVQIAVSEDPKTDGRNISRPVVFGDDAGDPTKSGRMSSDVPTATIVEYTTVYIDPQSTRVIVSLHDTPPSLINMSGPTLRSVPSLACDPRSGSRSFQHGSSIMNDSDLHVMESHIVNILQNMYEEEHTRNKIQKRICKRLAISIFIVGAFFVGFYMIFHKEARSM